MQINYEQFFATTYAACIEQLSDTVVKRNSFWHERCEINEVIINFRLSYRGVQSVLFIFVFFLL